MQIDKDTVAIVIKNDGSEKWDIVCATQYKKDGTWLMGLNEMTSIDDVLNTAEKNGLNIVFESAFSKKTGCPGCGNSCSETCTCGDDNEINDMEEQAGPK